MKVALVHMRSSWTGGTERYLAQTSAYLADRGHDVTIVCRTHRGDPDARVRYVFLKSVAVGGAWRQWAFANAVEDHVASTDYDVVYGLGKTWTHDVVRLGGGCHQTYLDLAHAATLSWRDRALQKGRLKHALALRAEARALAPDAYRRIVTNSEMVKRDVLARYGAAEDDVVVIYNGVDVARFDRDRHREAARALRAQCAIGERELALLFLGTGYGRKGLAPLLDALPAVTRRCPSARLMVVGFDSDRGAFEARARAAGIGDRVTFLGGRRDTEVCYAAADLYVLPTRYDPFANTTLEALASGLPVITTSTNGGAELVEDGFGAIVDRAGSSLAEALAATIGPWTDRERIDAARPLARACAEAHPAERTARESADLLETVAASDRVEAPGEHRQR